METANHERTGVGKDVAKVADFIMFTQRSLLLDLSRDLNEGNVSYAQFFLMGYLVSEEYLSMTDIAKKMGHSTAAATGLVDRLEKLGYVERLHAADDRRKVMVQITDKGKALVAKMREGIAKNLANVMAEMDDKEKGAIVSATEKVKRSGASR
jgi:DNA-binding MarR family transcriptional regulator